MQYINELLNELKVTNEKESRKRNMKFRSLTLRYLAKGTKTQYGVQNIADTIDKDNIVVTAL